MGAASLERAAEALVASLRAVGHPLPDLLRPGLSDLAIDEIMRPTGLTLPDEARALWRWADGVDVSQLTGPTAGHMFPGGLEMLGLAVAVARHLEHVADFPWSEVPEDLHSPAWFAAFVAGQDDYWLDTSVEADAPCPTRRIYRRGHVDCWDA